MRAIVATSPAYAQTSPVLSDALLSERLRVIPLGIEEHSYPNEGDESILSRLGVAEPVPYFLFIGVLRYYKGLHSLVQAAASVNAKVVIAGSGPEEAVLREQAHRLRASNVIFAGQVTDQEKVTLLRHCRALVLPSHLRSEAFGMVLVEAAMLGKPMISCEIGTGTSYVNAHNVTGFVVPPESPKSLSEAMQALLEDDSLAVSMGRAARLHYEKHFSGSALGNAYRNLYREMLAE